MRRRKVLVTLAGLAGMMLVAACFHNESDCSCIPSGRNGVLQGEPGAIDGQVLSSQVTLCQSPM
jgi:hypothetical protein